MGLLIILAAGALVYGWYRGKLKGFTYEDGIAAGIFLLGLRFLTTGKLLIGAVMMTGSILWAAYRRPKRHIPSTLPVDEARALLGVGPDASLDDIRNAHRRLIARVHPDAGGS